jgi:predicted RecB family nuclease
MDRVIKTYFDSFRADLILPPELNGTDFKGISLFKDQVKLDLWRDWKTGLRYEDAALNVRLVGALDDLLTKGKKFIPFDYKTKGTVTTREDAVKYYQNQLDCYSLMLEANGFPSAGFAFLLYYSPKRTEVNGTVRFEVQPIKLEVDPQRARDTIQQAVTLLQGPLPRLNPRCEFCAWLDSSRKLT